MDWRRSDDSAERFSAYLQEIAGVMGHAARVAPMRAYSSGLLLDCERKSVEPIAAATAPGGTGAQHQSLLHFLAQGKWSDEKVLGKVRDLALPQIEWHGSIEAWIVARSPTWSGTQPPRAHAPSRSARRPRPSPAASTVGRRSAGWHDGWRSTASPPPGSWPACRAGRNTDGARPPNACPAWGRTTKCRSFWCCTETLAGAVAAANGSTLRRPCAANSPLQ